MTIALLLSAPSAATTYTYNCVACGGNSDAGELLRLQTSYDDASEVLTWSSTFGASPSTGFLPSTAWLVLTDGPNPKGHQDQFSILYLDGTRGTAMAYAYDGVNGPNSYQNAAGFLQAFYFSVSLVDNLDGTRTLGFSLDASGLNAAGYRTGFGSEIGAWFHPAAGGYGFAYAEEGGLEAYDFDYQGWFDVGDRTTTPLPPNVPEPSLGLLIALGLAGLFRAGTRRL